MIHARRIAGSLLTIASLLAWSSSAMAEHLDRHETRRILRRLEERSDESQDRMDDWVDERHDERFRLYDFDVRAHVDAFQYALDDLKDQLRDREDPWEVRDQARTLIDRAGELNRSLLHSDFYSEVRHEWEAVRVHVNTLARHYQLPELRWEP